jgi:hypothetical protein
MPFEFVRLFAAISEIGETDWPDAKDIADHLRAAGRDRPANLEPGDLRELAQLITAIATELAPVSVPAVVVDEDGRKTLVDADAEASAGSTRKRPTLIAAWRKRMVFAWELASYSDKTKLIGYLVEHMKRAESDTPDPPTERGKLH